MTTSFAEGYANLNSVPFVVQARWGAADAALIDPANGKPLFAKARGHFGNALDDAAITRLEGNPLRWLGQDGPRLAA